MKRAAAFLPAIGAFIVACSAGPGQGAEPFDLQAIQNDPLDAKVLKKETKDGIVTEEVEFTSDKGPDGQPIRTFGILGYPEGKTGLPAILWGQGGMAPAGTWAPHLFAKRGYAAFNVTLPMNEWNAFGPFDTANPRNANLVRLAVTHMRAITYLASRPEVDKERIGMGGTSYGGVYTTMVAGWDPRVKAALSFFAGGNHRLGTNLPQYNSLATEEALEIFLRDGDGAPGLARRAVPFLWGVAANDHWFHLPAVVRTYEEAIGEKRLAIEPLWAHALSDSMDNQLFDWFDIYLKRTRRPYNAVSSLVLTNEAGRLVALWGWTGSNTVKGAELAVSYGRVLPWHGWVNRYHHTLSAALLDGNRARAEAPVPEVDLELLAVGSILDEKGVRISTVPVAVVPSKAGIRAPAKGVKLNAFPLGGFEPADMVFFERHGDAVGAADPAVKHSGAQSLRPAPGARIKLYNVYERSHRLTLWLRGEAAGTVRVRVEGVYPQGWALPAPRLILKTIPGAAPIPDPGAMPVYSLDAAVTPEWKEFALDCPYRDVAVEGYQLVLEAGEGTKAFWVDDVAFEPIWVVAM